MGYREEERELEPVYVTAGVQAAKTAVKHMPLPTEPLRENVPTIPWHIAKLTAINTFYEGRGQMDFDTVLEMWLGIREVYRAIMILDNANFAVDQLNITGFTTEEIAKIKRRYKEVKNNQ